LEARTAVLEVLRAFGATDPSEVLKSASQRLGFKRLGEKIRSRLQATCDRLVSEGQLAFGEDGRLRTIEG
jgi:hypothetical protein